MIGLGLVGAGRMGRIHADIVNRDVPEARLVAIADVDPVAARDVAASTGAQAYGNHHELIERGDVDAVVVVTPTHTHLAVVEAAARAGKDVFCEKPIALTVDDTKRAVAAAEAASIRLQVGLYRRFDQDYRRARERIRGGAIGAVQLVRSLQYDTFVPTVEFCDPAVSGGIAVDMGIHEFDIARWLLDDEIIEIQAFGTIRVAPGLARVGDVDTCLASMRFASGAIGSVELVRRVGYAEDVRTEVVGTEGSVIIGMLPWSHSWQAAGSTLSVDAPATVFDRFRPALVAQMRAFCQAILDDADVEPSGAESVAGLAAGIAAQRSMNLTRDERS